MVPTSEHAIWSPAARMPVSVLVDEVSGQAAPFRVHGVPALEVPPTTKSFRLMGPFVMVATVRVPPAEAPFSSLVKPTWGLASVPLPRFDTRTNTTAASTTDGDH